VAFLSDSTLKAVVENNATQTTMIANDWERNLLLFRGKTVAEIQQLVKDRFLELRSNGVVSIGTVDLCNVPFGYRNPCEVASEVAASIRAIQQDLGADSQICAMTLPEVVHRDA